jgi:cell wall-associated NlpC family hydrolase
MNAREDFLLRHLNVPYVWAGSNPLEGIDCSGFAQWYLAAFGLDPQGDQTAQGLYDHFLTNGQVQQKELGALAFYGKEFSKITHVGIHLSPMLIIEAGGGDSSTTSFQHAMERGACVRMRPVNHRKDYLVSIMPDYPGWVNA